MTKFYVLEENQELKWWPGAETKSTDCFSRGPEFGSKHQPWVYPAYTDFECLTCTLQQPAMV